MQLLDCCRRKSDIAVLLCSAITLPLLEWRMELPAADLVWVVDGFGGECAASVVVAGYLD